MRIAAGTSLGPYEVVGLVGKGAMGEVYRARDPRLGRDVAVKVLPESASGDLDRVRRFHREARAASALQHPGILTVYDTGMQDGVPFVVSELLEGATLREALRGGAPPVATVLDYALQTAEALAAAHEKGIVHRDLKPENLFVTRSGRVKILDFGLAKVMGSPASQEADTTDATISQTAPGFTLGTAGYMSPEQVRGLPADGRSDIFSFGAVLYEMLSGQRAFPGDTAVERMTAILRHVPPPLPEGGPVPEPLPVIVGRCLEKDAEKRYQSAVELAIALTGASRQLAPLRGASGDEISALAEPSPRVSHRVLVAVIAAIALVAGATAYLRRDSRPTSQTPEHLKQEGRPVADTSEVVSVPRLASAPEKITDLQLLIASLVGGEPRLVISEEHDSPRAQDTGAGGNPAVSLRTVDAGRIEIRAPAKQLRNAISGLQVLDALDGHRFRTAPSLFRDGSASSRTVSFDFEDLGLGAFIRVLAYGAGWPIVLDRSVQGTMTLKMSEIVWDQALQTCFELNDLRARRYGDVWLVGTRERAQEIEQAELPIVHSWRPRRASLGSLLQALEAARSETGLVLLNKRLGMLFIVDRPDSFSSYARILAALDRQNTDDTFPRRQYSGFKVSLDLKDADLQDVFRLWADLSGLNVVVEPGIRGVASASVTDVPWDNVLDIILRSQGLSYDLRENLLRIERESPKDSEVSVETVALSHESPEFFRPFARCLTRSGTLHVDTDSRTLVIRDLRKRAVWLKEQAEAIDRLSP